MVAAPSVAIVAKTRKILVIDDDAGVREALAYALGGEGYNVIEARDGVEGLARMRSEQPDIIFCDLDMPRMDGREFCRSPDVQLAHIPVVLVSGARNVKELAEELGVPFLRKPMGFDALVQAIETYARF